MNINSTEFIFEHLRILFCMYKMCGEHRDRVNLMLVLGIIFVLVTLGLQGIVVFFVFDINNTTQSFEDARVLSLISSIFVCIIISGIICCMYFKLTELLRTIDSLAGTRNTASMRLIDSDDYQ